ncbi:MAG: DsbA family protein [Campylobacteraceae bacterium]|nr:DsbA family protein [Campylobacteraceae bacterium]
MKIISAALLIAVLVMGAAAYWYKGKTNEQLAKKQEEALVRDYSPWYGAAEAKVVLVEFFDPACETCAQFYPIVKNLLKTYDGKLKVVYRYAPLHKNSDAIAVLLEALRKKQKFEKALEILFANQNTWVINHTSRVELAVSLLKANDVIFYADKTLEDMSSEEILARVSQDIADAKTLGVTMTPEFFVNGRRLEKFGYKELVKLIEDEIKKAY